MSFPVKGSEELRLTFGPKVKVETWGKWTTVAKGDRESSPSLERQKVLSQEDQGPPGDMHFLSARSGLTKFRSVA